MAVKDYVDSDTWFQYSQRLADLMTRKITLLTLLAALVFIFNFPIYYIALKSLQPLEVVSGQPLSLLPTNILTPPWQNFATLWTEKSFDAYFSNSVMVALTTTVIVMFLGTLAGYGFSRFRFPFDNYVFVGILVARLLPPIGLIIPFFRFFQGIGLLDTEIGLIVTNTYFNLPLVVWIMRNYFISIPRDLDEAAYVDGATRIQTFKDIILPAAKPGIAATAILTFLFSWREFTMALVLTISPKAITVPVGATFMVEDVTVLWNLLAAAGFLAMLPGLAFVIIFQKYVVTGLVGSTVKG